MTRNPLAANRAGFTLVELLVVIAVIATLAAMTMMVVRDSRDGANMAVCVSNMRQIGLAMQMHADDNRGCYPDTSHTASPDKAWIYQLEGYLGKFDETRICPADPKAALRRKNKASSYILNSLVFLPPVDAFGGAAGPARNKPSLLAEPSRTILVFIASDRAALHPGDDHTHSEQWSSWSRLISDVAPDRHKKRSSKNSTHGYSNYLYADSSVRSIPANEIKRQIENGNNIARVPGVSP
jgi:prepilin-type N-terminal cleavage/methylation domain-containing protein